MLLKAPPLHGHFGRRNVGDDDLHGIARQIVDLANAARMFVFLERGGGRTVQPYVFRRSTTERERNFAADRHALLREIQGSGAVAHVEDAVTLLGQPDRQEGFARARRCRKHGETSRQPEHVALVLVQFQIWNVAELKQFRGTQDRAP